MLYTNYKQVAKLVLKSEDAVKINGPLGSVLGNFNRTVYMLYSFKPTLPFYKFTKNTRLAVDTFVCTGYLGGGVLKYTGDVIIKNFKKSNIYNSNPIKQGTVIYSGYFNNLIDYRNNDIINNSIDITGATDFLNGNELDIFVDTRLVDDNNIPIRGCISNYNWSLTLVIFEQEKEENPKDYVDDRVKNYSLPALY